MIVIISDKDTHVKMSLQDATLSFAVQHGSFAHTILTVRCKTTYRKTYTFLGVSN